MTASEKSNAGWRAGIAEKLELILLEPNCTRTQACRLLRATVSVAVELVEEAAALVIDPPPELIVACDAIALADELLGRCLTSDGAA